MNTYRLLQTDSQINDRDVGGGDTEGHTGEFAARKTVRKYEKKTIYIHMYVFDLFNTAETNKVLRAG